MSFSVMLVHCLLVSLITKFAKKLVSVEGRVHVNGTK